MRADQAQTFRVITKDPPFSVMISMSTRRPTRTLPRSAQLRAMWSGSSHASLLVDRHQSSPPTMPMSTSETVAVFIGLTRRLARSIGSFLCSPIVLLTTSNAPKSASMRMIQLCTAAWISSLEVEAAWRRLCLPLIRSTLYRPDCKPRHFRLPSLRPYLLPWFPQRLPSLPILLPVSLPVHPPRQQLRLQGIWRRLTLPWLQWVCRLSCSLPKSVLLWGLAFVPTNSRRSAVGRWTGK
jgi:hypothetical protein